LLHIRRLDNLLKKVGRVIKALTLASVDYKVLGLVVVGSGEDNQELQRLAKHIRLRDCIILG